MNTAITNAMTDEQLFCESLKGGDPDVLYKKAQAMVNSYAFYPDATAEHIAKSSDLASVMWLISLHFIKYWGEEAEEWRIDDRNAAAHKVCKAVLHLGSFQELNDLIGKLYSKKDVAFAEKFIEHTKDMHKTLLQTFAGLVFGFINQSAPATAAEMTDLYGPNWFRMPLV